MSSHSYDENFISIQQAVAEKNTRVLCGQTETNTQTNEKSFRERNLAKHNKVEQYSVDRIPPQGWTVYVLYPTDVLDLNQNLIRLFLSPNQLIHLVLS